MKKIVVLNLVKQINGQYIGKGMRERETSLLGMTPLLDDIYLLRRRHVFL